MSLNSILAFGVVVVALIGSTYLAVTENNWVDTTYRRPKAIDIDVLQLYGAIKSNSSGAGVGGVSPIRGINDRDTVWAVFFHRPYCGACRRIKPSVQAIAQTLNGTGLRFAMIDCTKFKNFCEKEGADKQPRIFLYKTVAVSPSGVVEREVVAAWSGLLIGYELFRWFKQQQKDGVISRGVEWADEDTLASAISHYKGQPGSSIDPLVTQHAKANASGYITDITSALHMGLVDDIFRADAKHPDKAMVLKGRRLRALQRWVTVVALTFPQKSVRDELVTLKKMLSKRKEWGVDEYTTALKQWGVEEIGDEDWRWCAMVGAGVGGYPCGLWTLFHTMLANSEGKQAEGVSEAIHLFVTNFFGCAECAQHFDDMWKADNADAKEGHIENSLWLWEAHNRVRDRLSADDTTTLKHQWPGVEECESCHNETESVRGVIDESNDGWAKGYIFEFLQEVYCVGSDTLPCAQFWKPQVATNWLGTASLYVSVGIISLSLAWCMFQCMGDDEDDDDETDTMFSTQRQHLDKHNGARQSVETTTATPATATPAAATAATTAAKGVPMEAKKDK